MANKDYVKIVKDYKYTHKCGFFYRYGDDSEFHYGSDWFILVKNESIFFNSFIRYILKYTNEFWKRTKIKEKKFFCVIFSQSSFSLFEDHEDLNGFMSRAGLSDENKEEIWEKILNL